jgi:cell division protein FtsB
VLLFVASLIIVDTMVGDRGLPAMLRARREYDELAVTIAREKAENARLRAEARRLREDPTTIEEIARRELGLIRPGERVFIIKDLAPAQARAGNPDASRERNVDPVPGSAGTFP